MAARGAAASPPAAITAVRPAAVAVAGRRFTALGTFGSLLVTDAGAMDDAYRILSGELQAIDLACSRFRPDSEISALNEAGGQAIGVTPLFAEAIQTALTAALLTGGDVDPTCGQSLVNLGYDRDFAEVRRDSTVLTAAPVPAAGWRTVELDRVQATARVPAGVLLDLGATAKALAADRAAALIGGVSGCGVLVNLGGDIAVAGPAPAGGWRVEIADHLPAQNPAGRPERRACGQVVAIEAGGLATSSTAARRWHRGGQFLHHIVTPGTGRPAEGCWRAVSVAAATCVDANIASTAAIIRGDRAPAWLAALKLPARLIRRDGTTMSLAGWPAETEGAAATWA
jgi:thiamine biosynthesis lipoprotein